jgi:hypothetical protein
MILTWLTRVCAGAFGLGLFVLAIGTVRQLLGSGRNYPAFGPYGLTHHGSFNTFAWQVGGLALAFGLVATVLYVTTRRLRD